jgi:hypothetical protein
MQRESDRATTFNPRSRCGHAAVSDAAGSHERAVSRAPGSEPAPVSLRGASAGGRKFVPVATPRFAYSRALA